MTDEQKADLAVLPGWVLEFRHLGFDKDADALQRIHDALSARLADAVQPAAGEGGLRFGVAVTNIAASDVNPIKHGWYLRRIYRSGRMNGGAYIEYLTDDGRVHLTPPDNIALRSAPAFAALSTSVPAGVVK